MTVEYVRGPDGLFEDERRRRVLAERLAAELATSPGGRFGDGNDFVTQTAVRVRLRSTWEVDAALDDARTMVAVGGSVGQVSGVGGSVLYVHMPDMWSVVFPYRPFTGLILVCDDDLDGHCWQLDDDSPEAVARVAAFRLAVGLALGTRRKLIADGMLPPDPNPLLDLE